MWCALDQDPDRPNTRLRVVGDCDRPFGVSAPGLLASGSQRGDGGDADAVGAPVRGASGGDDDERGEVGAA